jgi:hypothetical protein
MGVSGKGCDRARSVRGGYAVDGLWSARVGREGLTSTASRLCWVYAWLLLRAWGTPSIGQGVVPPSLPSEYGGKGISLSKFSFDSHNPVPTIPPFFSYV